MHKKKTFEATNLKTAEAFVVSNSYFFLYLSMIF